MSSEAADHLLLALMPELGLMLVQAPSEQGVHNIQPVGSAVELEDDLDDWQKHFNSTDPRAIKFPQPMDIDWGERSDVDYDVEHINLPRKLAQVQLVSVADRNSAPAVGPKHSVGVKTRNADAQTSNRPTKRTEFLFQRIKDSNKRKSGVAGKTLSSNAPKTSETVTHKPPTMVAVKHRADLKRAQKEQAAGVNARKTIEAGTRSKSQNWDYEDEADSDSEYEPLRISRYANQQEKRDELRAGPSQGDTSSAPLAPENTEGDAETSGGGGAKPSKGVDSEIQDSGIGKGGSVPNLSGQAQSGKLPKKKEERVRRQRLVSYYSQVLGAV